MPEQSTSHTGVTSPIGRKRREVVDCLYRLIPLTVAALMLGKRQDFGTPSTLVILKLQSYDFSSENRQMNTTLACMARFLSSSLARRAIWLPQKSLLERMKVFKASVDELFSPKLTEFRNFTGADNLLLLLFLMSNGS